MGLSLGSVLLLAGAMGLAQSPSGDDGRHQHLANREEMVMDRPPTRPASWQETIVQPLSRRLFDYFSL